jgi:hypothetical protein
MTQGEATAKTKQKGAGERGGWVGGVEWVVVVGGGVEGLPLLLFACVCANTTSYHTGLATGRLQSAYHTHTARSSSLCEDKQRDYLLSTNRTLHLEFHQVPTTPLAYTQVSAGHKA